MTKRGKNSYDDVVKIDDDVMEQAMTKHDDACEARALGLILRYVSNYESD